MHHYQLTPNLGLTVKPCQPAFRWFAGKTNRLALYSLSLCGLELDLYIARHWDYLGDYPGDYPAGEDDEEFIEGSAPDVEATEPTASQNNS